ncbi:MAG: NADH-quinone oxidoreductase subunit NuoF [Syntrophomonadaceae bacterium]|nr:NADH-quinone oxidoreductase subunit NuoF [Syntrophomonadaceae bacterium]
MTGGKELFAEIDSPAKLAKISEICRAAFARQKTRFLICAGTGCVAMGSLPVLAEFKRQIAERGLAVDVEMLFEGREAVTAAAGSGCHGFCEKGPLVRVEPQGIFYNKVKAEDVAEILAASLDQNSIVERLLYKNPDGSPCLTVHEVPFYSGQTRNVLERCGLIDPEDIREYFAHDGYQALAKALREYTPEQVIEIVSRSNLRGRGGAGFTTGKKWATCRRAPGDTKYVVCNCDEGDPGAFMDRSVLEADPHAVLEGMAIAAYAVGAERGFLYVRAEYPLAVARLQKAMEQAIKWKVLGENIMGCGFNFYPEIFQGAGAFVCGEETSLLASLEGGRGMPRMKPPFPAEEGLWKRPTVLNNVKTLAKVPKIIDQGADWFAATGTVKSPGTAVFALTGKIKNSGLIEVPMGITLREIVYGIGGGIINDGKFKAVQTGGPSGGCLPEELLELEVDFDSLRSAGSMMGSGGMVVLDEKSCMVDIARYFLEFTVHESCGQCTPCRDGIWQMLHILNDITAGKGRPEDLALLEEMGKSIIAGAICGLGKTAPNPVLSTLRYFRPEYEAHIQDKACPALNCQELIAYQIDPNKCKACGRCRKECPVEAIKGEKKTPHVIEQSKCCKCGICLETCPAKFSAVSKITGKHGDGSLASIDR